MNPTPAPEAVSLPKVAGTPPMPKVKDLKPEGMTFMGYEAKDMTRDGLMEVVKYQWWDKGQMEGKCEEPPELNYDKIALKESPFPRKEITVDKCHPVGRYHDKTNGCPFLDDKGCNIDFEVEAMSFKGDFPDKCPLRESSFEVSREIDAKAAKDAFRPMLPVKRAFFIYFVFNCHFY